MTSSPSSHVGPAAAGVRPLDLLDDERALNMIARRSGFLRRRARKLSAKGLLHALLQAAQRERGSLRHLAFLVGHRVGGTLAKQSLWERLQEPACKFLLAVLARLLMGKTRVAALRLPGVRRVLVGDSSTLALHPSLKDAFPGSSNQAGSCASARLQFAFDLLSGQIIHQDLHPFTRVDQAAASDLLPLLQPGDLLIRDLGYFALNAFGAIDAQGSYFLSRHRFGLILHDTAGKVLDLLRELRKCSATAAPGVPIVLEVQTGANQKLPMRLIAIPMPKTLADQRRRRARADRDQRLNHSADYYALLGWTILLTNLPPESLPPEQMLTLYSLRWRIENVFRAWKSNLHPEMTSRHRTNQHHLRCLLHAQQILLLLAAHDGLLAAPSGPPRESHTRQSPPVSLFKHLDLLLLASGLLPTPASPAKDSAANLQRNLLYHSHYECRKRVPLPRIIARLLS